MAEKNWLIRTKNKQILGPATKQKIIELIQRGSLTGEDEITSGNGYWFWIKEEELLEKYVFGDEVQVFNPISEAEDVLTAGGINASIEPFLPSGKGQVQRPAPKKASPAIEETLFPSGEDLEYPNLEELVSLQSDSEDVELAELDDQPLSEDDHLEVEEEIPEEAQAVIQEESQDFDLSNLGGQIAQMKAQGQGQLNDGEGAEQLPPEEDLEYPDMGMASDDLPLASPHFPKSVSEEDHDDNDNGNDTQELSMESIVPPKKKPTLTKRRSSFSVDEEEDATIWDELDKDEPTQPNAKIGKQRNDKYLFFILILVFFLIAVLFYYYKMVLNKPLPLVGISEAHAQTITNLPLSIGKKKSFLNFKI